MTYTSKINHVPQPWKISTDLQFCNCYLDKTNNKGLNCSKKDLALKGSETLEQVKKGM